MGSLIVSRIIKIELNTINIILLSSYIFILKSYSQYKLKLKHL